MRKLIAIAGLALALTVTTAHADTFTQAQIDAAANGFNVEPDYKNITANQAYCYGYKSTINYARSLAKDGKERHIQRLQREMQTYADMGCMAYDKPTN